MELTNRYRRVACEDVIVPRDQRQRREILDAKGQFINKDGLLESIERRGVLSPLLLQADMTLIFGERRLTASKLLGIPDIPVRFVSELTPDEAQVIELEENLCREALPWRDEVRSVARLHALYKSQSPEWSVADTKNRLNYGQVNEAIRVARDLESPRIAGAESVRAAWNILARQDDRAMSDAISDIMETPSDLFAPAVVKPLVPGEPEAAPIVPVPPPEPLLNTNFIEWAAAYTGPRFNFIHCDFPYGQDVFNGPQSGRDKWETYVDETQVYETLIRALCTHLDKLMSHSAHLMFWCSADFERQASTVALFRKLAPSLVFDTFPLTWHKTDNVGVLPDSKRGPRRVTETALIARREDRLIVKAVSNAYGAPTDKTLHPSCKPEPVLRYFFSMFVDENTRLLDPTCGSGTALRAAESLGAQTVLGLESSLEHFEGAQKALRQFRALRKVTR